MEESNNNSSASRRGLRLRLHRAWEPFSKAPLLGWLFGFFIATALEQLVGTPLSHLLGLPKIPVLFGFVIILKQPALLPSTILYVLLIYLIPMGLILWLSTPLANKIAEKLLKYPLIVSLLVHVGLLYASLYLWAEINDYRDLILRLMLISIIITLSLNVVNGYMGEFSCSHPGFIALGAYGASKTISFMFAAFWAGVAGGLFAHVMRYVNPGTFGIQKLAEVLAMVYFGGLNSVVGSVVGAVGFNILSEALRPLEMFKWIIIPVLLILVMIYRPSGLIAFKEFDIAKIVQPKRKPEEEVENAITSD